ncbi:MAG: hypothetical protein KDB26_14955 [Microthrixaceae bacterium]|nr:hypothetical protein [Microthrixaceae bacterium]
MSSLWTPGGERQVPPPSQTTDSDAADGTTDLSGADPLRAAAAQLGLDLDAMTPDEIAELQAEMTEMMRVRAEMAQTPAHDMLANHLMRLFDLAIIYLEADPPKFGDAATVIEAFRSVVDGVGDRLGSHRTLLQEALSQMQMIFVQVKNAGEESPQD